eukprot:262159_1
MSILNGDSQTEEKEEKKYPHENVTSKNKHDKLYKQIVNQLNLRYSKSRQLYAPRGSPTNILQQFKQFIKQMKNPHKSYQCIHVTGTNGKGSVCTKLANALFNVGYNVGLFTSPHISCVRERIVINNKMINEIDFANGLQYIFDKEKTINYKLTYFELICAVALNYFKSKSVHIAILEVACGGRYDTTNILDKPLLSVIVSIGLDHQNLLGDTIEKIAYDKCGIIKPEIPVIIGVTVPKNIAEPIAKDNQSPLYQLQMDNVANATYDEQNTKLCELAIRILSKTCKFEKPLNEIYEYLNVKPNCRFEICTVKYDEIIKNYFQYLNYTDLNKQKYINIINENKKNVLNCILDVAHNHAGFIEFFKTLQKKFVNDKYLYRVVMGIKYTRTVTDLNKMMKEVSKSAYKIHFIGTGNKYKPGKTSKEMYDIITTNTDFDKSNISFDETGSNTVYKGVLDALYECYKFNQNNNKQTDIVCIIGSCYLMKDVRKILMLNDQYDEFVE